MSLNKERSRGEEQREPRRAKTPDDSTNAPLHNELILFWILLACLLPTNERTRERRLVRR